MKIRFLIVCVLSGAALTAFSYDYIDDVYYWSGRAAAPDITQAPVVETIKTEETKRVQVTFIEDSITQHSDTIVKAVIRR